jgi:repressor LexA
VDRFWGGGSESMSTTGRSDEIGQLIRSLREQAGITQEALASAIGCSKAHLSLMESGQRTVSLERAQNIERALKVGDGRITAALQWQSVPAEMRAELARSRTQSKTMTRRLQRALDGGDPLKELRRIVEQSVSNVDGPLDLRPPTLSGRGGLVAGGGIPVINKVAAGYPAEFTDLDYPRSVADDYILCPDITDPDAFAARVVGDSMEPDYREGDIVIFAPSLPTPSGIDCFVRLERDNQTTFKRIYVEDDGRTIRLQPLNNAYPPRAVDRQDVSGMYAAAYVMRRIG